MHVSVVNFHTFLYLQGFIVSIVYCYSTKEVRSEMTPIFSRIARCCSGMKLSCDIKPTDSGYKRGHRNRNIYSKQHLRNGRDIELKPDKYNRKKRLSETMLTSTYPLSERENEGDMTEGSPNLLRKVNEMNTICEIKDSEVNSNV